MSRTILFAAFLLAATAVQAVSPARESANGGGGNCPEAEESAVAASAEPAPAVEPSRQAGAAPTTPAPVAPKGAVTRARNGARWHSFVPGMFK
jgi:hypothetical protein